MTYFRICNFLVFCFVLIGGILTFITPPFVIPDEQSHWQSAAIRTHYFFELTPKQLCDHKLGLISIFEPTALARNTNLRIKTNIFANIDEQRKNCDVDNIPYGNRLTYYGNVLATWLNPKEILKDIQIFYASRLFQGLLISLLLFRLVYLCSQQCTYRPGLLTFCLFCLNPLMLQQSFSVSSDGIMLASAVAGVNVLAGGLNLRRLDVIAFILLGTIAIGTKQPIILVFVGVCLFFASQLHLKKERHTFFQIGSKRIAQLDFWVLISIWFVAFSILSFFCGPRLFIDNQSQQASPSKQIDFIFQNIPAAVSQLMNGIPHYWNFDSFVRAPLGWMNFLSDRSTVLIWKLLIRAILVFDLFLLFYSLRKQKISDLFQTVRKNVFSYFLFFALVNSLALVFSLTMFLLWTQVGAGAVDGLQLRYFFPISILCIGIILYPRKPVQFNFAATPKVLLLEKIFYATIAVCMLFYCNSLIFQLLKRYY